MELFKKLWAKLKSYPTISKREKSQVRTYMALAIFIGTVGLLLVLALFFPYEETGTAFPLLVRSETVYIILTVAVLLLGVVFWLIHAISEEQKNKHVRAELDHEDIQAEKVIVKNYAGRIRRRHTRDVMPAHGAGVPVLAVSAATKAEDAPLPERFSMLSELDRRQALYTAPAFDDTLTLRDICDRFRAYAASEMGLYYDIADIRRFVAGLAVTHIVIMQGMSGTGTTSLAHAFGRFLQNDSVIVPIQPMWKERTDMIGYFNEFTKKFNETVLLRKMYEANGNDEMYITVLDEMNIARVEYYFAEFLSLLELPDPEDRYLDVVADRWENDPVMLRDGQIRLPENMWFVGTANNDDSTFAISDKVYDRAMVINLDRRAERFEAERGEPISLSCTYFQALITEAQAIYGLSDRSRRKLSQLDAYMIARFHVTFGNRIMKQIEQYVPVMLACGGDELDALDDILARKVLRKLESQNPVYVRSEAEGLLATLDELFGPDRMPLCRGYLARLERSA